MTIKKLEQGKRYLAVILISMLTIFASCSKEKGKIVIETMDAGIYTYIKVKEGGQTLWAASNRFPVKVGDRVEFTKNNPMKNFESKTLNRTFDEIYFVDSVVVNPSSKDQPAAQTVSPEEAAAMMESHAKARQELAETQIEAGSIEKATGGYTVAECFEKKNELKGKTVKIRGKVVKFNENIMGKNWLHIQDGSGVSGSNDLTVTSSEKANKGDIVLIEGKLSLDRDFGAGYKYPLIIEEAKISQ